MKLWGSQEEPTWRRSNALTRLVNLCHPDLFVSGSAAAAAAEKRMKANQHVLRSAFKSSHAGGV
jgi:hypothetical protein